MNITVVGATYIGLPLAVLLSQYNNVHIVDSNIEKVAKINRKENPINEKNIEKYFYSKTCKLKATLSKEETFTNTDCVVIALETFYDAARETFDVRAVEKVIKTITNVNGSCLIIICSTIPVGYTALLKKKFETDKIICVPEFLTEENAIDGYLYPEKIVIGASKSNNRQVNYAEIAAEIFLSISENKNVPILHTTTAEAETIKLFFNTYTAMRAAFFNFMDTYTSCKRINTDKVTEGILLNSIVGNGENHAVRYGAYYLPDITNSHIPGKDDYADPITLMLNGNALRKEFIDEKIDGENSSTVGIYKLLLKDRHRNSLFPLINQLTARGIKVATFDPDIKASTYKGCQVIKSFESFKAMCNVIIADKITEELTSVSDKVYEI